MPTIHESGENYLEAIHMLDMEKGTVRSIDVANQLGFSKPTVSVAVHTLERDGFITISDKGFLELTEAGREIAVRIYERHRILTDILVRLGVDPVVANEDACKLEHDLSFESFEKIKSIYNEHIVKAAPQV